MVFTYLVQAFMGNGPFEPALFVSEAVTYVALVLESFLNLYFM